MFTAIHAGALIRRFTSPERPWRPSVRTLTSPPNAFTWSRWPRSAAMVVSICCAATSARPATKVRSTFGFLSAHGDESGGLTQEVELAPHRLSQMRVQIQIRRIGGQCALSLGNCSIYNSQVLLDNAYRGAIQLAAVSGENTLQIGNSCRVALSCVAAGDHGGRRYHRGN